MVHHGFRLNLTLPMESRLLVNQYMSVMVSCRPSIRPAEPLQYVGADVWFGDIMALYSAHEIKPMIWLSPKNNPWFDKADFEKSGALLIATSAGEYAEYQQMYGETVSAPQILTLEFKNYFGKTATKDILYGFYEPWEVDNAAEK